MDSPLATLQPPQRAPLLGTPASLPPGHTLGRPPSPALQTGVRVLVGNRRLMVEQGVVLPSPATDWVRAQEGAGCTCVLVAAADRCDTRHVQDVQSL